MKKFLSVLLIIFLFYSTVYGSEMKLLSDEVEVGTINVGEEQLVPVRKVCESNGAIVEFDASKKVVLVEYNQDRFIFPINSNLFYKNDLRYTLSNKTLLKDGITYISIEAIERIFGDCELENGKVSISEAQATIFDDDNTISIIPKEDTFVSAGENSNKNFGSEEFARVFDIQTDDNWYSKAYFKFDISRIPLENISRVVFRAKMDGAPEYYLTGHKPNTFKFYAVGADSWNENELNFLNQPEKGKYIAEGQMANAGFNRVNYEDGAILTEYVKEQIAEGKKEIAFIVEGVQFNLMSADIKTKEYTDCTKWPVLMFDYNANVPEVRTDIYTAPEYGKGVNPLENAKRMIASSGAEYGNKADDVMDIFNLIDNRKDEEYQVFIEGQNGEEKWMPYTSKRKSRPSRTLDQLIGYEEPKENIKLSKYGGRLDKRVDNGNGFFRVKKIDGRWTFIDPEGYEFYSYAKCNVRPMPDEQSRYTAILNEYKYNATYDTTWEERKQDWADTNRELYREFGFNSLGGWSLLFRPIDEKNKVSGPLNLECVEGENAMPLGSIVVYGVGIDYAGSIGAKVPGGVETFKGPIPMVFNPDFEEKCHERIKEYVTPWKDNPWIMGWWSDNEINELPNMLDISLDLDPTDPHYVYTYVTAWEWLKERTGKDNPTVYDITDELREDYREFVWDRYYKVMSDGFKKYAPNHLYFGTRHFQFSVDSPGTFRAAARYCDVVSYNLYRFYTPDIVDRWAEYADVPVQITEWYSLAHDGKGVTSGGYCVDTVENCGVYYENYTLRLLEAKNVVGFHYFSRLQGEEHAKSVRRINSQIYNLIDFFDNRRK